MHILTLPINCTDPWMLNTNALTTSEPLLYARETAQGHENISNKNSPIFASQAKENQNERAEEIKENEDVIVMIK